MSNEDCAGASSANGRRYSFDCCNEDEEAKLHPVENVIDKLGFGWYQVRVIIILGFVQSTDTMETLIQAILGPSLRCDWQISSDLVALLATMVFLGVCLGAAPMGYLSDRYGRKNLSVLSCIALIYFTILCAFAPVYGWISFLRFVSGIFISGLLSSSTSLITELMPEAYQSTGQLIVYAFDSIVAIYVTGVGLGCLRADLSWRWFLMFSTCPLLLSAIGLGFFTHESPVLLASWGRTTEAAETLDSIASSNRRVPVTKDGKPFTFVGRLAPTKDDHVGIEISWQGFKHIVRIFHEQYQVSAPILLLVNFLWGFIIYGGTTLLPVELPSTPRTCLQEPSNVNLSSILLNSSGFQATGTPLKGANADCCLPLGEEGYQSLFAAVIGSVLSFPISFWLIWGLGRKWTITACFGLASLLLFALAFCMPNQPMRIMFFLTRAVVSAGYNATNIYLTELFTANVRSLGFGVTATAYRLGVLTAPYIAQVYLHQNSALGAVLIFFGLAVMGTLASAFLPHIGTQGNKTKIVSQPSSPSLHANGARAGVDGGPVTYVKRSTPFRNIFKSRPPISAEEASAVAAGGISNATLQQHHQIQTKANDKEISSTLEAIGGL